jgi:hypothetical protein
LLSLYLIFYFVKLFTSFPQGKAGSRMGKWHLRAEKLVPVHDSGWPIDDQPNREKLSRAMSKWNDGFDRINCRLKNVMTLSDSTYGVLFTGLQRRTLTRFVISQDLVTLCDQCNWQISLWLITVQTQFTKKI